MSSPVEWLDVDELEDNELRLFFLWRVGGGRKKLSDFRLSRMGRLGLGKGDLERQMTLEI